MNHIICPMIIGMNLLFILVSFLLVASIGWYIHVPITIFHFYISLILALGLLAICRFDLRQQLFSILLSYIILAISIGFCSICWDPSYDGMAYHQPAIYALANDWNPIYNSHNTVLDENWNMGLWVDHYCKGMEVMSATIYSMTGNLESGKAINLLFPIITFCLTYCTLPLWINITKKTNLLLSLGLSFSEITACQLYTFYIDQLGYYSILLIFIFLGYIYRQITRIGYLGLASIIIMTGTTKINMFFWSGFFIFVILIYLLKHRQCQLALRVAAISLFTALFTIFIFSFNPYITNIFDHGNPIYPLGSSEESAMDIVEKSTIPTYLLNHSRIIQVFCSYFTRPSNDLFVSGYVHPYSNLITSFMSSGMYDTRLGGAGFFFIEILFLSIFVCIGIRCNKYTNCFLYFLTVFFITPFILPMGSTFRYVPFIYYIPFVALIYSYVSTFKHKYFCFTRYILIGLLFVNVLTSFTMSSMNTFHSNKIQRQYVQLIKKNAIPFYSENWSFLYKLTSSNQLAPSQPTNFDSYELITGFNGPSVYILKDDK